MRETSENQHNKSRGFLKDSLRTDRKMLPRKDRFALLCPFQ